MKTNNSDVFHKFQFIIISFSFWFFLVIHLIRFIILTIITRECGGINIRNFSFIILVLFLAILISGSASAATINIDNSTVNAIRNAITTAQAGDTLNLSAGTYNEYDLVIDKDLTITGPITSGTPTAVIDAQKQGRVFYINEGVTVTLKYLTLQNGKITGEEGGGICNAGTLTVTNSSINNNTAEYGGGIYNKDGGTITGSIINGNTEMLMVVESST